MAFRDSVSSGERKRKSLNQQACLLGLWDVSHEVIKEQGRRSSLERLTEEGNSPVPESLLSSRRIPSSAGHGKPRMNPAGPSAKAKYSLATDSEAVP